MIYPSLHLNGTSFDSLLEDYNEAIHSLQIAYNDLLGMSPNGRDYYPQSNKAFADAVTEHSKRLTTISSMVREIEDLRDVWIKKNDERKRPCSTNNTDTQS